MLSGLYSDLTGPTRFHLPCSQPLCSYPYHRLCNLDHNFTPSVASIQSLECSREVREGPDAVHNRLAAPLLNQLRDFSQLLAARVHDEELVLHVLRFQLFRPLPFGWFHDADQAPLVLDTIPDLPQGFPLLCSQ